MHSRTVFRRCSCQLTLLSFFLLCVVLTPLAAQAQKPILDRIPTTAFAGISVKPKSMLEEPSMEFLPTELIQMFGQKELGLELLELESVLVVVDPPEDPNMSRPPKFAVIARFATPQQLGGNVVKQLVGAEFDGVPGYRLVDDIGIAKLDEMTFILAPEDRIIQFMEASENSSPLIDLLKSTEDSALAAHVVIEPVRNLIKDNLPPADSVPPPFGQLLDLPDLLDSISYVGITKGSSAEQLTVRAVDQASAKEVVQMVNNLLRFGKNMAMGWLQQEEFFGDPDYKQALMQYAERMAAKIHTAVQPDVDGQTLVFNIERQGSLGTVGTSSMLVGLLLPAVQQAREAARRAQSMNNLKQLGLAIYNYSDANKRFPPQYSVSKAGKPLLSWRVHILPYLEQQALYDQFRLDEPWDSEHNIKLIEKMPMTYINPNVPEDGRTVYLAVSGEDAVFEGNKKIWFPDIHDGTSNTAMIVEVNPEEAVYWTQPADWECSSVDPFAGLGGIRPGGFLMGRADGSTELLPLSIDPKKWAEMTTRTTRE